MTSQDTTLGQGPLRVGLVGLGEVAQVVHLPVLAEMPDLFRVVAACDIDIGFARRVADRHHIDQVHDSVEAMLAAERLDVVAVLNSDEFHAEVTCAALDAGCHVLLEKPAALAPSEMEKMIRARERSGKQVMVGYMRRHAAAYEQLRDQMPARDSIKYVSVRDIIGPNSHFIRQIADVIRPPTVAKGLARQRSDKAAKLAAEALGQGHSDHAARAFRLLTGLGSHDLSALRGLVGAPRAVRSAWADPEARFVTASLDYGSFLATYEAGLDAVGSFDAHIEVFDGTTRRKLSYDTPYIRHLPTTLATHSSDGDGLTVRNELPGYRDPYTRQWRYFHKVVRHDAENRETLEGAVEDLKTAIAIARRLGA